MTNRSWHAMEPRVGEREKKELMEQEKLILAKDSDQRFSDERGKKSSREARTLKIFAPTLKICN